MSEQMTVAFKELTLTDLKVTLHPHKGGDREDGSVALSWRERWEKDGVPSMFYSITGSAVINGVTRRVTTNVPAVKDGTVRGLGTEFTDRSGNTRIVSKYPAPQSLEFHTDEDGEIVLDEALPVSPDGKECPLEFGLSFLMHTGAHKGLVLRNVVVTKDEPGEGYMDVHALSGHAVIDVGVAAGAPLTGGFAAPRGEITRKAARDTRTAAPATVDVAM